MTNTASVAVSADLLSNPPENVAAPTYDRQVITEGILHIGVGGFHRSHQALYLDEMLQNHGASTWAICGVGIMPQDATMHKALTAQNNLYTLVEKDNETCTARLIGSLKSYIFAPANAEPVFVKMADPAIKIVTLTATEGGYYFHQATGELDLSNANIRHDLENPQRPKTIFGYLAEGLKRRRQACLNAFTILSCDNLQGNGHIAKKTLIAFCRENNPDLAQWIEQNVSFPNCMVDRITPATGNEQRQFVQDNFGLNDAYPVVSEVFRQWVIEDDFGNGRPELEKVGVQFTSDVAPYEKMKIRLLNASHSAMGYLGYLCGYRFIFEIAQSPEFVLYIRTLMDREVTPLIGNVSGVNLGEYKLSLIKRFANESIKDQALRICMDGSSKMPKFILPSILEQLEKGGPIRNLTLCVASWIRFLAAEDEDGQPIPIDDPQAQRLIEVARKAKHTPKAVFALTDLFGELGKSERFVIEFVLLLRMLYEKGAHATLRFCNECAD
jgi:mannitol 2-dehydrogenase